MTPKRTVEHRYGDEYVKVKRGRGQRKNRRAPLPHRTTCDCGGTRSCRKKDKPGTHRVSLA